MQEVRGRLDGRSSSTPDESRSPRVELLRLTVVTARERIHSGEGERIEPTGPGRPHVSDRRIHHPPCRVPVPKGQWCVVIDRRRPPEETARLARSARAEGQHTESALDAGDGEVTETSDLDHVQIGLALYACPGAASARRATHSDSAQRITDAYRLECPPAPG